jgi:hypothetical protein
MSAEQTLDALLKLLDDGFLNAQQRIKIDEVFEELNNFIEYKRNVGLSS